MNLEKEYKARMKGLQKYMTNKKYIQIQAVLKTAELHGSSLYTQGSWDIPK